MLLYAITFLIGAGCGALAVWIVMVLRDWRDEV